jgi:hypothetical protein
MFEGASTNAKTPHSRARAREMSVLLKGTEIACDFSFCSTNGACNASVARTLVGITAHFDNTF